MYGYVAIALLAVAAHIAAAAPPLRVTIDCGSSETDYFGRSTYPRRPLNRNSQFDVESFCQLIHASIPKTVKDGHFILRESDMDQGGYSDTLVPVSAPPPYGFIPKFAQPRIKAPRLQIPNINVPKLRPQIDNSFKAPRVKTPKSYVPLRSSLEEDSSVEKMEKFKKGVQKMLHVVKVLGQIDQYLSERTRIIIDKLAKTFAD